MKADGILHQNTATLAAGGAEVAKTSRAQTETLLTPAAADPFFEFCSEVREKWKEFSTGHPRWANWLSVLAKLGAVSAVTVPAVAYIWPTFSVVRGRSMEPNVHDGDKVVQSEFTTLQRFDLVTLTPPCAPDLRYIKRVVGFGGEIVELKDGELYIDGEVITQPDHYRAHQNFSATKIPDNAIFVLGDNRDRSSDSREFGMVLLADAGVKEVILQYEPVDFDLPRLLPRIDLSGFVDAVIAFAVPKEEQLHFTAKEWMEHEDD